MHPHRLVEQAMTPKAIQEDSPVLQPIGHAAYSAERPAATAIGSDGKDKVSVFQHGTCPVRHRSEEAAAAKRRNP
jgi:hypothetical protein